MRVGADGNYPRMVMPIDSRYFPRALLDRLGYTEADYVSFVDGAGRKFTEVATRSLDRGNRVSDNTNEQYRFVIGANTLMGGWDVDTALNLAQARGSLNYEGYLLQEPYLAALATGNVNPFGPNDAAGVALLDAAQLKGNVRKSKATTLVADVKASRELMQMDGGAMALALGADLRKDKADDRPVNIGYSLGSHIGGEGSVPATSASRSVYAVFGELALPFTKELEATVAARYDHYSDFGGSFNPMVRLRYQPSKQLLLRASAGTGFRAPTLWDVNSPVSNTNTADPQVDPDCPVPPDAQGNLPALCNTQFNVQLSSSPNLKPEKSRQFTAGIVFEPMRDVVMSLDYWNIQKRDQIGVISGDTLMAEPGLYQRYKSRVKRTSAGFISYIETPVENLGELKTAGLDLDIRTSFKLGDLGKLGVSYTGTRVMTYDLQNGKGEPFTDYVGKSLGGNAPVPEWQHTLAFDWSMGDFNVALENVFTKGWTESAAVVLTPTSGVERALQRQGHQPLEPGRQLQRLQGPQADPGRTQRDQRGAAVRGLVELRFARCGLRRFVRRPAHPDLVRNRVLPVQVSRKAERPGAPRGAPFCFSAREAPPFCSRAAEASLFPRVAGTQRRPLSHSTLGSGAPAARGRSSSREGQRVGLPASTSTRQRPAASSAAKRPCASVSNS
jgi:iron complex outermembrane receptor protein